MIDDRTPPNDELAEQTLLGYSMALGRIPEEAEALSGADFYRPQHELLWRTMLELISKGKPCGAVAVHSLLQERGQLRGLAGYLPELLHILPAADPAQLVEVISDRAMRRRIIEAHTAGLQAAYESSDDAETILQRAEQSLARVPAGDSGNVDSLSTLDEFLSAAAPEPEWVIEHYLARDERLVITGSEGLGKTTLCRQLAVCAAAGIDPFNGRVTRSQTVLAVDVENPRHIMQKRYSELRRAIHAHGVPIESGRFWLDNRPEGLDLSSAADRRWLQRRVRIVRPDLLVIGPAYKLHEAGNDDKDETIARSVTSVLDQLRVDANCGLILEHHAGHGSGRNDEDRPVRPFGSSLWRRWPEFGFGLRAAKHPDAERRRIVDVVPWRGARDVRSWPRNMESGGDGLPWVECAI